jgi:hypothetical protein
MPRQLISSAEAVVGKVQHRQPCSDCPFARTALPGWLGSVSAEEWVQLAHGEGTAECHTILEQDCAGLAIYRANICKVPRDRNALRLPPDTKKVFAMPSEFIAHHKQKLGVKSKGK